MRIGFVIGAYAKPSETFVSRKVEFLLTQGHEVVVFQLRPLPDGRKQDAAGPILVNLRGDRSGLIRSLLSTVKELALAPRRTAGVCFRAKSRRYPNPGRLDRLPRYLQIAKHNLDILHVHFASNLPPILGVKDVVGVPVVVSLLGSDVTSSEEYGFPEFLRLVPQESDALIAACAFLAHEFRRRASSRAAIHVLAPEVPAEFFHVERRYEGTHCRLLTVARLHWKKGLTYAVDAARELKRRGLSFSYEIIGDGEDVERLRNAIHDGGLEGTVALQGPRDPREIPDALARADIFLLPSVNEGAAGALLEAQAAGLPVVSTRVGGIPESVRDLQTGFLVPPRDSKALADAIERLIRNPALRQQLGLAGQRRAREFDTERVGSRLVDIYYEVLAKRNEEDSGVRKTVSNQRRTYEANCVRS